MSDRCTFEVGTVRDFPGSGYDLVTFFDALHDLGDPIAAAVHVRESLSADGIRMFVEPNAGDRLEEHLNPLGRIFYGCSTMICVPVSRLQDDAAAPAETPFNMVLEARP